MGRKVLVLNADYSALSICSVPKAFVLVFSQKAELVSEVDKVKLRTVSTSYPMPSVIKLNRYINIPYKSVVLNRQNIFKRDGNACVYCGTTRDLTLDHVIPKSKGGRTNWLNLVAACRPCNSQKGNETPEQANMPMRHQPFKPTFIMYLRDFFGTSEKNWAPFLVSRVKHRSVG
ncbi:5-methylcytosine-specific restriction endonuclease McrA [Spirosomataceae bacterium TFI 002]|nr:5-methylcytosine-specific restriction endonuclease McrA [Spirosomataceae bacterium TFI 002]